MDDPKVDFFVSYTGKDKAWAEWTAWQLEAAGYHTLIQAWDFKSGGVFPGDMHRALLQSARVIAILTPEYMASGFCQPEWQAAFAMDPTGEKGILVSVRVADFQPDGLLTGRTYIDLVGLSQSAACDLLLQRLKGERAKPIAAPPFPPTPPAPAFPGNDGFFTAPYRSSTPNNLPRLQSFFGRKDELATIREALDSEARTWGALIDGVGGMGKTSLALKAAYDCPPGQFERIIFVSIKDRELEDDGPRSLGNLLIPGFLEMLNEIARELGQPDLPKSPEDQRIRLLLEALKGSHVLLILDNLEALPKSDRDQLFTFVKRLPQGCKAILTSRRRIGSSADTLILEKLDEAAALEWLEDMASRIPLLAKTSTSERLGLYAITQGKPLLLRWIAGQLGRGSCRTFADAVAFLKSCPPGNDPLEFIFGDIASEFTPEETKVLCALSFFTLPVEVHHIAANCGLPESLVETALRSLSNRSLTVSDQEEKVYSLVPLVADFLAHSRPGIIKEMGQLLVDRAYSIIMKNGYHNEERFPLLEAEWPGIAPAMPLFLIGKNEVLQMVCPSLSKFFIHAGRRTEFLTLNEKAEIKAVNDSDYFEAGWRAYDVGFAYHLLGDANSVKKYSDRVVAHWSKSKIGSRERACSLQLTGMAHQSKGDGQQAIDAYKNALNLLTNQPPWEKVDSDLANALNYLAIAEMEEKAFADAEKHLIEALGKSNTALSTQACIINNLATLALIQLNWQAAEAFARKALALNQSIHRIDLAASCHQQVAEALLGQGKAMVAVPHAKEAVNIYRRLGSHELPGAVTILKNCLRAFTMEQLTPGWTYNTTTLEGSTLSLEEVTQVLSNPTAELPHRPAADIAANRANESAKLWLLDFLLEDHDWTKADLFQLHTLLMLGSIVDIFKPIGAWKKEDNFTTVKIDGNPTINNAYGPALYVHSLMDQWLLELNQRRKGTSEDPFQDYLWLHATFARIHPFADGNGRMARLLANIPLLAAGLYPVDIPATARDRYLESLARWQVACGLPELGHNLFARSELLADFMALCASSRMPAKP